MEYFSEEKVNQVFFSLIFVLIFPSLSKADICSRTSKLVGTLEGMLQKKCQYIEPADLALLYRLEVGNWWTYIPTLKEGDFEDMPNLRFLSVDGCNLETIGPRTLKGLIDLKEIEIGGHPNSLRDIPEELFQDTPNVERISLASNNLESLPTNLFQGLKKLKVLVLDYNRFSEGEKNRIRNSLPNVQVSF